MKIKILFILALLLTMTQGAWAQDELGGEFSVSAVKKVHFSRGNLRATTSDLGANWTWTFAEHQWDYVGNAVANTKINGNKSVSGNGTVDLFGFSTETTYYGIHNSNNNGTFSNAFKDWGEIIGTGWFTMSNSEWTYLLNSRTTTTTNMPTGTNSDYARYIKAQVASENGLILFPDKYAHPADASVTVSSAAYNTANKGYGSFTVNAENWTKMEEAGAVFLPAGGYRHGTGIIDAGSYGAYWSSTSTSSDKATSMDFSSSTVEAYNTNRSTGCSVRLVIESHTITYNANGGEGEIASQPKYTDLDRTLSDGTGLTRSDYILDGWATAADGAKVYDLGATYTEEADVTLYAHWTPVNYTISYDLDGGSVASANPTSYNIESAAITLNNPTKDGYTFAGWTGTGLGEATTSVTITTGSTGDRSYTATWTENTATLSDASDVAAALSAWAGKTCTVTYTRSFTADKPSTVCLPFAYTKKTGDGSFYAFSGIEKVGSEYIATMTEPGTSTLTANTPYLYKAETTGATDFSGTYAIPASITAGSTTSGSGDWTFKGTYSTIEWTDAPTKPTYGFSAQDANAGITQGQFVKVGSYVRIKPMRAYLEYNGSDSQFTNARSLTRAAATTSDDTLPETIGVRLISANGEVTAIGTLYTRTGEVSFDSEAWYTLDGKRLNAKPNTKGIYVNNGKKVVIK